MKRAVLVLLAAFLALPGCAAITIKPVDFSWSFESVLTTDDKGIVRGEPKTILFNATQLFQAEGGKEAPVAGKTVRIIRNAAGYYFVTSPGFKHVYIFEDGEAKLSLEEAVLIDEKGMEKPFFNRREAGIELAANGQIFMLNEKGIMAPEKKK